MYDFAVAVNGKVWKQSKLRLFSEISRHKTGVGAHVSNLPMPLSYYQLPSTALGVGLVSSGGFGDSCRMFGATRFGFGFGASWCGARPLDSAFSSFIIMAVGRLRKFMGI